MGGLVEDLLLLARLDQKRPLSQDLVDLGALAADAVADARASSPVHPITLETQGDLTLTGDAAGLRQVAANLLANATTHTPPGTEVRMRLHADEDSVFLEVADNGPGIPPESSQAVFERFFRGDPARSRSTGGSGLGLSIVAAITEAHGGTVIHSPTPEGGATFRMELPRQPQSVVCPASE